MNIKAYGAHAGDQPLEPIDITRRAPGEHDVQIAIAYCGVCHSDRRCAIGRSGRARRWAHRPHPTRRPTCST